MCYHPWAGLDISPQGEFKPCCKFKDALGSTFDEYESNPALAQLKQDFENGVRNPGCYRCWKDEDAGIESKRILDNKYVFEGKVPELNGIKVLGMTFGNTCNLACRTCNSYASSKWTVESTKAAERLPEVTIYKHNQFYRDAEFLGQLKQRLTDVVHVDFAGGEPFYANPEAHFQILEHLLDKCDPSKITLHYVTNGTKLPSPDIQRNIWPLFKKVDIQLSIDGLRSSFEYIRWPASWTATTLNIGRWQALLEETPNMQLSISTTVSIFNVWDLPELLAWFNKHGLPKPYLGLVSKPEYFSITVFPKESKELIAQKLSAYPDLLPIVNAMWAKDDSHLLDLMIKHVKINDTQRKQSFVDTFPTTYNLLSEQCQTLYQLY